MDEEILRSQVRQMYTKVAEEPQGPFHFEMGRALAERLRVCPADLDPHPSRGHGKFAAWDSTSAWPGSGKERRPRPRQRLAAWTPSWRPCRQDRRAGHRPRHDRQPIGESQILAVPAVPETTVLSKGYLEEIPLDSAFADVVISNGVINLCPDKPKVFQEAARVLKRGGRLAISDIVTETQLTPDIVCNASLWAACIGGAMQEEAYRSAIEASGFKVVELKNNPEYRFLSKSAQGATQKYGVRSVSLLAVRL